MTPVYNERHVVEASLRRVLALEHELISELELGGVARYLAFQLPVLAAEAGVGFSAAARNAAALRAAMAAPSDSGIAR